MTLRGVLTAATLAASAFLLFLVEPLVARQLLPRFGGSAAVWLTALLFFQGALLLGYLAADLAARRLSPRAQAIALGLLYLAGLATQPVSAGGAAGGDQPALRVLAALAASVGLPFLALSATGPLVQAWWARTRGAPWRLYAVSNAASLLGLFAYPAALEPLFELQTQARLWSAGYLVAAALVAVTGWRAATAPPAPAAAGAGEIRARAPRRWAWLVLPACTSALLLAVTAHLTQNVAPIPLLWVLPLAAYLLSFVLAFEGARPPLRRVWLPLAVLGLGALARAASAPAPDRAWVAIAVEVLALLAACTAAHGELARERPAGAAATRFYLALSAGSALGALWVAVAAPLAFRTELELPLSLLGLAATLAALLWREALEVPGWVPRTRVTRTASLLVLWLLAVQLAVGEASARRALVWAGRSFYGALRVADDTSAPELRARLLFHGNTIHGQELLPPADPGRPLGYYGPTSGAGRALQALRARSPALRVGLVGLGVGVLAAWCRPGDAYAFYELDPLVIEVAQRQFGFLRRCAGAAVLPGDARLTLAGQPPQRFDLLVLDAFSSDAIPLHLLTREAFVLFASHLAPGGLLAVHISNRSVDLSPVLASHAAALGLQAFHLEEESDFSQLRFSNRWMLLVPDEALVRAPAFTGARQERVAPVPGFRPWTDAWSNLIGLLDRR